MGNCASAEATPGGDHDAESFTTSRSIDKLLRADEKRMAREVKVSCRFFLVLAAGDSTVLRVTVYFDIDLCCPVSDSASGVRDSTEIRDNLGRLTPALNQARSFG